jgi:hypothetical protein
MSTKADFSADQWDLLRAAPMMASILVIAASPSGPVGLLQESTAAGKMILAPQTAQTPLPKSLAEDLGQTIAIPKAATRRNPRQGAGGRAAEILKRTAALLNEKATPEEASETKQWLVKVAQSTAEATKEGGFLGFGGTLVYDEEKAALARVNSSLSLLSRALSDLRWSLNPASSNNYQAL